MKRYEDVFLREFSQKIDQDIPRIIEHIYIALDGIQLHQSIT